MTIETESTIAEKYILHVITPVSYTHLDVYKRQDGKNQLALHCNRLLKIL